MGEAYLWLSAAQAYFGGGVDLSNNSLGLSDFRGAWFGGAADFDGAHQLQADFSAAAFVQSQPIALAPQAPARAMTQKPVTSEFVAAPAPEPESKWAWRWRLTAAVSALAVLAAAVAALVLKP